MRSVLPRSPISFGRRPPGPVDFELLVARCGRWCRLRNPQVAIYRLSRQGCAYGDLCDRLTLCSQKMNLRAVSEPYGVTCWLNLGWLLRRYSGSSCDLKLRSRGLCRRTKVESRTSGNRSYHNRSPFNLPLFRSIGDPADNFRSNRSQGRKPAYEAVRKELRHAVGTCSRRLL